MPFPHNVCLELDGYFSNDLAVCSFLLHLVPSTSDENFTPNTHEELIESVDLYEDGLPYPELFGQQYFHWKTHWKNKKENITDTAALTLKYVTK